MKITVTLQCMTELQWKASIDGPDESYAALGVGPTIPRALEDLAKDIRGKAELNAASFLKTVSRRAS